MTARGPLRKVTATHLHRAGHFVHDLECGHSVERYRRYREWDGGIDFPYRCRCGQCGLDQALEVMMATGSEMFDAMKFKIVDLRTAPRRQIVRRRTRAYRDGGGTALHLICGHTRYVKPSKAPTGQYSRCGPCKEER